MGSQKASIASQAFEFPVGSVHVFYCVPSVLHGEAGELGGPNVCLLIFPALQTQRRVPDHWAAARSLQNLGEGADAISA